YSDADRLVLIASAQQSERGVRTFSSWSQASYDGLRSHATAFDHLAAYTPMSVRLTGRGEPLQVPAADVSPNFLQTLGVVPARDRHGVGPPRGLYAHERAAHRPRRAVAGAGG